MKTLSTLFLVAVSFGAFAQRSSSKHVTTDGRELHIQVDIEQSGRSIHYSRSIDVADMENSAVKALETSIVDSVEQAFNEQLTSVAVGKKHESRKNRKAESWGGQTPAYERATYAANSYDKRYELTAEAKSNPSFSPSDVTPSTVLIREDKENGRLWMQYTFEKDGEQLVIERTANVIGKSESEKKTIIKDTEQSFGIKLGNQ